MDTHPAPYRALRSLDGGWDAHRATGGHAALPKPEAGGHPALKAGGSCENHRSVSERATGPTREDGMRRLAVVLALALAGCGGVTGPPASPAQTPGPTRAPSPSPTPISFSMDAPVGGSRI